MLRVLLIAFAVSRCYADLPITTPPPVLCGEIPSDILYCIGSPMIMTPNVMGQCAFYSGVVKVVKFNGLSLTTPENFDTCEKFTCGFRKSNWMDGDKIDKQIVSAHFEQLAQDSPVWETAVENIKTACLSHELPAQGIQLKCPAYDMLLCILTAFIKNAPPSQWSQTSQCKYARQFAAECPMCPNYCLQKQVPEGSCNACLVPPRSIRA